MGKEQFRINLLILGLVFTGSLMVRANHPFEHLNHKDIPVNAGEVVHPRVLCEIDYLQFFPQDLPEAEEEIPERILIKRSFVLPVLPEPEWKFCPFSHPRAPPFFIHTLPVYSN